MRILFLLTLILLASCGDDNDNDNSFVGAADIQLDVTPNEIDTGDRTQVSVEITNINSSGIILKILYPEALSFVSNSGSLEIDGDETDLTPSVLAPGDAGQFAVFFIPARDISAEDILEDPETRLTFVLEANETLENGVIAVDADVDDPLIDNSVEFNIDQPQFVTEDREEISVIG